MELTDREFYFQDLFENTSDLIQYVQLDGSVHVVNRAWLKILQYSEEEVIGTSIYHYLPEECVEEYRLKARVACEKNVAQAITTVLISKSGGRVNLEGQLVCILSEDHPAVVRAILRKTTTPVTSARRLQVFNEYADRIFDAVPDGVVIINQEDIILDWNFKAEEIFGFTADEVIGASLAETIVPPRYREVHLRALQNLLNQADEPVSHKFMQLSALRKDGKEIYVNLSFSSIGASGNLLFIGFVSDISDNKTLERKLIRKEAELLHTRRLDEKKDEFLSIASHELKTPLTTVKAYTQIGLTVAEKNDLPVLAEYLRKADRHIDKLTYLINELLDISKIQAGTLELTCTRVRFDAFFEEVISSLQHITPQRLHFARCGPVYVNIDRVRLEQVITNIVSNASKYAPGADRIDISCKLEMDNLVVTVQDYGIGISEDKLAKIFDRFYRIDEIATGFSGLGIGLYIAAEIIRRHGGKIWAESTVGNGSRFSFNLPLAN